MPINKFFRNLKSKSKYFSTYPLASFSMLVMILSLGLVGLFNFSNNSDIQLAQAQSAPTEPNCQTVATTPTWNPYPINNNSPSPLYNTGGNCQDMPLLSFFPIESGNPREKTILRDQNLSLHLYYNNGAKPGSGVVTQPIAGIQVIKESETKYKITAFLDGSNAEKVTSSQKGGDLILNVPAGTNLSILGSSTYLFPKAVPRKYESDTTGRSPRQLIADNSSGSTVSNPAFTQFDGNQLASSTGTILDVAGVDSGFLHYGYILTSLVAKVEPVEENNPPTIPGEEITIIRGESGSFKPLNPTDPDEDYPVVLDLTKVLSFCNVTGTADEQGGGQIIVCDTAANTPVRSEFVITPTDSKGLVGQPGRFIVNIIEPGLSLTKICYAKGTQNECKNSDLSAGDAITYQIKAQNTSDVILKNLTIVDDYDEVKIADITNISDSGELKPSEGKIFWNNLDDLPGEQSKMVSFDAKVGPTVKGGDTVANTSTATADGVDPVTADYNFIIPAEDQATATLTKLCVKNNNDSCDTGVTPGESITYKIIFTNTSQVTAINVKVVDEYDSGRLINPIEIKPNGSLNQEDGTITWELGDVPAGESKEMSFKATTRQTIPHGTVINNIATSTGDNIPERKADVDFPIEIPPIPVTPRTGGGLAILMVLFSIALAGGGYYYYKNSSKFAKAFNPARSGEDKETSAKLKPTTNKAQRIKTATRIKK
jgi:uncharacterized repeat protein (TIGR01451 family)